MLNALLLDLRLLFSKHLNNLIFFVYFCHLDSSLPRRAPPNLQVNFDLLRKRSDASHRYKKRHDPLDDHGSSAPYPGYGGQGVRRGRQTDERPRSGRVAEGRGDL